MHLNPGEIDKLMLHNAGFLAQKRYARGVILNYVETVALISAQLLEFIRDGDSVGELMNKGKSILGLQDVMSGVPEMLHEVQVEGTFLDGTKLVTVHEPVCRESGNPDLALFASGLTRSEGDRGRKKKRYAGGVPGELLCQAGQLTLNEGRERIILEVLNTGDRPVQVGSHYSFFETNPALEFDRAAAFGKRLDIPAGTAVRFEPGERKEVALISFAGGKKSFGGNGLINGSVDEAGKKRALAALHSAGFRDKPAEMR